MTGGLWTLEFDLDLTSTQSLIILTFGLQWLVHDYGGLWEKMTTKLPDILEVLSKKVIFPSREMLVTHEQARSQRPETRAQAQLTPALSTYVVVALGTWRH